jgi:phosphoribosyl 1,2-cyclic phosphate phosphodiesterase
MKKLEVEILGSGTSMGVPMVGCDCRVCLSTDSRDKRLRTSALIRAGDVNILIDTSMDYRQQMLRSGVTHLDAVIFTHHHVDHILGLDDLRCFNILNKKSIPLYGLEETLNNIRRVFAYAFTGFSGMHGIPRISVHFLDDQPFRINGVEILPIPLLHGSMPVLGFRVGDFAYCTDVNRIPESSYERLRNLKVLILDALRYKPHPTHFSVEEAVGEAQKIGAEKTYFTHISHAILHEEAEKELPEGIFLAYDGLKFELEIN